MNPSAGIKTVLQRVRSIFEPPDARWVTIAFYGIGMYSFANYGTLDNVTVIFWTIGSYTAYALVEPSIGIGHSEKSTDDTSTKELRTESNENFG